MKKSDSAGVRKYTAYYNRSFCKDHVIFTTHFYTYVYPPVVC